MSLDWKTLHSLIGLEAPDDGTDLVLSGVSSLKDAQPGEVSFLGNERYYGPQLAETRASVVLVASEELTAPEDCRMIVVDDPSAAFTRVIDFFQSESREFVAGISKGAHVSEESSVDSSKVSVGAGAVLEEGCVVGEGTSIGSGCLIGRDVRIGKDCTLHPGSIVRDGCILGDRVILQSGAVVGADGYGYQLVGGRHEKVPQVGIVEIGNDVEIGANSCIDRARFGKTVVGEGTKIDNLVQVAHNVTVGKHCLLVAQSGLAGSATLRDYVTIAAQSGVAGHIEIGEQVILAGQSGFQKSTETPGVYFGNPARPMTEERRKQASLARLPKLKEEIQLLKKKLEELAGE